MKLIDNHSMSWKFQVIWTNICSDALWARWSWLIFRKFVPFCTGPYNWKHAHSRKKIYFIMLFSLQLLKQMAFFNFQMSTIRNCWVLSMFFVKSTSDTFLHLWKRTEIHHICPLSKSQCLPACSYRPMAPRIFTIRAFHLIAVNDTNHLFRYYNFRIE